MSSSRKRPRSRPGPEELAAAYGKTIPDVLAPRLKLLFVGINPSLYSAAVGHHFARPGNRFWPGLYHSRITPRLVSPHEDAQLIQYGCGLTNLVPRATARADELAPRELERGGCRLAAKIRRREIACVAMLGITAYRQAFGQTAADVGPQKESLGGAPLWVLPNPSGLNAHYQLADFAKLFRQLDGFAEERSPPTLRRWKP